MAEKETLGQPLLQGNEQGNDVETGQQEPNAEENAELLKEGTMSWNDLLEFFANPSHWVVTVLVVYSVVCLAGLCYLFVDVGNFDLFHRVGLVTFLAVVGLSAAAYNAFLSEQLKEEVNKYWRLNQKLKSNKARLESTCKTLRSSVGKMHDQVDAFQELKSKMEQFEEFRGAGFKDVVEKASGILDSMKSSLMASQSNLLTGYAMKMEYLDGEEGMTEEEFDQFRQRLPPSFQNTTFGDVSEGKSTASCDQVQELIDRAVKSLAEP